MRKKRKNNKTRSDLSAKPKRVANKKKAISKRKSRAPKTRNHKRWSESQFWQFIRSSLRNRTRFWVPRLEALKAARRVSQSSNKRLKWEFQCCECKLWWPQKEVEVHHIEPVGTLKTAEDLPKFVENLFCEMDKLAVICKKCHSIEHEKLKSK